jgi:hypothetical protein
MLSEKKISSDNDSGMVTVILLHFKSKSLLPKKIMVILKKPETSRKWRRIQMKSVSLESKWSNPSTSKLQLPTLNNKENPFLHRYFFSSGNKG